MDNPLCILIFSGKRKSGKDYITERLLERIGRSVATVVRISAPIKGHWAKSHGLDFNQLLDSSDYKEQHRVAMIQWSEEERSKDYGCFCKLAAEDAQEANKSVWIVSDARRKTDLLWFRQHYGKRIKTIRVHADDTVRSNRGWTFTPGVDDVASECDLDDVTDWDLQIMNSGEPDAVDAALQQLEQWVDNACS